MRNTIVVLVAILILACLSVPGLLAQEMPPNPSSYRLDPVPASLRKMKGIHPRLILNPDRVKELRRAIKTTHSDIWKTQVALADAGRRTSPPVYKELCSWSGAMQNYQRVVGRMVVEFAITYKLSRKKVYLEAAEKWALTSCNYPTWGLGNQDGVNLAATDQLIGLAFFYDWCFDDMDGWTRKVVRETLLRRGKQMFEPMVSGRCHWHDKYFTGHFSARAFSIGAAGLALFGETEDAGLWVGYALDRFRNANDTLADDGAGFEGISYWSHSVQDGMIFRHAAKDLLDVDLWDHPWWRNTANYLLYLTVPRESWTDENLIVDIADSRRYCYFGPEPQLRGFAGVYRDPYAQWLADQLDEAGLVRKPPQWMRLFWYDRSLAPESPSSLPTMRHFENTGIVSSRSDWSGSESLVVFKCGPFIGHKAIETLDPDYGSGHMHPDANHFLLFGAGEWLIRDDGYTEKWTGQHNTLVIDGYGQVGEGGAWYDGSSAMVVRTNPRVLMARSSPGLDHIAGDATDAYHEKLGVERYIRHLLFVKPELVVVLDDVRMSKKSNLELRFHPEHSKVRKDGNAFILKGEKAVLRVDFLTPDGSNLSAEDVKMHEKGQSMFTVRAQAKRKAWRNAVALSWAKSGKKPRKVELETEGRIWTLHSGKQTLRFDWSSGEATLDESQ